MRNTLFFILPLPPSVNEAYRDVSFFNPATRKQYSRRVASSALRQFKRNSATALAQIFLALSWQERQQWQAVARAGYKADVYMKTAGADLSNRLKAMEDVISESFGFNDNRIYELQAEKYIDRCNPRVEIHLSIL